MSSSVEVVESVENNAKLLKPRNRELGILDVGMVGDNVDFGVEFSGSFFCNLVLLLVCVCISN